jgi:transcriptional regulator with XRE-family HTH domain
MKGQQLKKFRNVINLSQREFAKLLCMQQSQISRWESGSYEINNLKSFAIMNILLQQMQEQRENLDKAIDKIKVLIQKQKEKNSVFS